jgi:hypothetical protein
MNKVLHQLDNMSLQPGSREARSNGWRKYHKQIYSLNIMRWQFRITFTDNVRDQK